MPDFGFKIAKNGHAVSEAEKYMRLHSKYPVLKLKQSGTGTGHQVASNGGFTIEITHNLGYVPVCFVKGEYFDTTAEAVVQRYNDWNRYLYQGLQVADYYYYYADTTKLYIVFNACYLTDAYTFDLDYMYHIFYDEDTL